MREITNGMADEIKLQNYPHRVERLASTVRIKFNNDMCIFSYIGTNCQLHSCEKKQTRLAIVDIKKIWISPFFLNLVSVNCVKLQPIKK